MLIPIKECIICFEETSIFIIFECNHEVCHKCYTQLIKYNHECPLCRIPIMVKEKNNKCCELTQGICCILYYISIMWILYFLLK